jgi:hypothetical protein
MDRKLGLAMAFWASFPTAPAAACHLHAIWHYPWAQRCWAPHPHHLLVTALEAPGAPPAVTPVLTEPEPPKAAPGPPDRFEPPMPLPALDFAGGAPADDAARGRLMLRSIIGPR